MRPFSYKNFETDKDAVSETSEVVFQIDPKAPTFKLEPDFSALRKNGVSSSFFKGKSHYS